MWRGLRTHGRGVYTHVERFPGWPHGNRTQWSCFRRAQGQKSDVGIPPRLCTTGGVISPPLFCPLWLVYPRIIHRNNSSNGVTSPPGTATGQVLSIISTVCTDFDRQFDYRCHSRWMNNPGAFCRLCLAFQSACRLYRRWPGRLSRRGGTPCCVKSICSRQWTDTWNSLLSLVSITDTHMSLYFSRKLWIKLTRKGGSFDRDWDLKYTSFRFHSL